MTSIDQIGTPRPIIGDLPTQRRRIIASGVVGTMLEWFDFVLYGLLAPSIFDRLFFPPAQAATAGIAVLVIYGTGYLARPLGALVFGHFGDRIGRKPIMYISLSLMGVATILLGLIPTYAEIGLGAPIMLLACRTLQGFALGGEVTGMTVLATESGPEGKRGLFTSYIQVGGVLGSVLASLAATLVSHLPEAALLSWGWRLPFVMSAVLVAIGLYVRTKLEESAVFLAAVAVRQPERVPLLAVFRRELAPTIVICLCSITQTSMHNIFSVFGLIYGIEHAGAARVDMLNGIFIGNAVGAMITPFYGYLSDRVGRRPLVVTSMACAALYAYFVFYPALSSGDALTVTLGVAIAPALIQPMIFGVTASYFAELIRDPRIRFTGVGFGGSVGSLVGGFFPAIAQTLLTLTGTVSAPIAYYAAISVLSISAVLIGRETAKAGHSAIL